MSSIILSTDIDTFLQAADNAAARTALGNNFLDFTISREKDDFYRANDAKMTDSAGIGAGSTTWTNSSPTIHHGLEIRTTAATGAGAYIEMAGAATAPIVKMDGTGIFDLSFRWMSTAALSNTRLRMGLCNTGRVLNPVDYIGFRFDVDVPDTNIRAVAQATSTPTLGTNSFGAPAGSTAYVCRMWCLGDGTIHYTVNGANEVTLNAGLPSTSLIGHPFFIGCTNSTVDVRVLLDYYAIQWTQVR